MTIGILGVIILCLVACYESKRKALKAVETIQSTVKEKFSDRDDFISAIINDKIELSKIVGSGKIGTYIIHKNLSEVKVQGINNNVLQTLTEPQYTKLVKRLHKGGQDFIFTYRCNSFSIYCKCPESYRGGIIKIEVSSVYFT